MPMRKPHLVRVRWVESCLEISLLNLDRTLHGLGQRWRLAITASPKYSRSARRGAPQSCNGAAVAAQRANVPAFVAPMRREIACTSAHRTWSAGRFITFVGHRPHGSLTTAKCISIGSRHSGFKGRSWHNASARRPCLSLRESGRHILVRSSSHFDPNETWRMEEGWLQAAGQGWNI